MPTKPTGRSHRYGKLPARHDARTLKYTDYLTVKKAFAPVPATKYWFKDLPADWKMMGNDTIGDCTVAATGHLVMNWTGHAKGKEKIIPDKQIITAYSEISGYNPKTHANDYGANLLDVLNHWRKEGIGGDRITGYVGLELANRQHLEECVYIFGGAYIGLELPDTATPQQKIWSVPASGPQGPGKPNPNRGHCVCVVGYDERYLYVVTWGKIKQMTWSFYVNYCDEAYAVLSTDWLKKNEVAPQGFNMNALQKDLKEITKPIKVYESGEFSGVPITDAFAAAALKATPVKTTLGSIPWPSGLAPQPYSLKNFNSGAKINGKIGETIDTLILAYTNYELEAFLEVFTGKSTWSPATKSAAYAYTHNFSSFKKKIDKGWTNALKNGILGYLIGFSVGTKKVLVFKSELHPKNNGKGLPFVGAIQQLVDDVDPKMVITTGTSGGIGSKINCGDVAITTVARLHCQDNYVGYGDIALLSKNNTELKNESSVSFDTTHIDYANAHFLPLSVQALNTCHDRFKGNSDYNFLKKNLSPQIYQHVQGVQPMDIVSADYLTVDDTDNLEDLQPLGILNDTDDAFAVYALKKMTKKMPPWVSIRNASEPQITDPSFSGGETVAAKIKQVKSLAGSIYGVYQYCTTLNSAFACWAVIAGL